MKDKRGRKLLSWLLTAGMLVSMLPTAALADEDQPDDASVSIVEGQEGQPEQDNSDAEQTGETEDAEEESETEEPALYEGEGENDIATYAVTWDDSTTEYTLNNGDTVAGYEFKNSSPVTIYVRGTATINGRLRAGNNSGGLTIIGDGESESILKFTTTSANETACLSAGGKTSLNVKNITIDSSACSESVPTSSGGTQDVSVFYVYSPLSLENVAVKRNDKHNIYLNTGVTLTLSGDIDLDGMSMPYYNSPEGIIKFNNAKIKSDIIVSNIRIGGRNNIQIDGKDVDVTTQPFKIIEGASYRDFARLKAYQQKDYGDQSPINTYYDNGSIYIYTGDAANFPYTAYGVYLGEAASFTTVTLGSDATTLDQNVSVVSEITPVVIKPKASNTAFKNAGAASESTGLESINTALAANAPGLTATWDSDGNIQITGKPTKNINYDLSQLTWPDQIQGYTVDLSKLPDGLTQADGSGDLTQKNVSGNITEIKLTVDGDHMAPTAEQVKAALGGDASGLTVTVNGDTITISGSPKQAVSGWGNLALAEVEAKIGDTKYADLASAIGAAKKGDTVDMKKNPSSAVADATLENGAVLKDTKGKTYTATADNTKIGVGTDGKVTLKSGKANVSANGSIDATLGSKSGTVTSTGRFTVDADNNQLTVTNGSTATLGKGAYQSPAGSGDKTFTFNNDTDSTVSVPSGGTVSKAGDSAKPANKVTGVQDGNTKVTVDETTGDVTLIGGKGSSTGIMNVKFADKTGLGEKRFTGLNSYTVDADNGTLKMNTAGDVKMGDTTFTGKANDQFQLAKDGDNTTATIPAGASVTGKDGKTITGVANDDQNKATKVSIDQAGNATLIQGAASVAAGGEITAKVNGKNIDIKNTSKDNVTVDLTKLPAQVGKLDKGDSISIGGIIYTCDSEGDDSGYFPIDSDEAQLKKDGDKAEVKGGNAAKVKLGTDSEGKTAPVVEIPASNTGDTKLTKGQPSTVELGKAGDKFTVKGKDYTAASDGAKFNVAEDGSVSLADGSATVAPNGELDVKLADKMVPVKNNGSKSMTVTADAETGKGTVTADKNADGTDGSVTIGSGDNAKTYPVKADGTEFGFDKDGNVSLAAGKTGLSDGSSITGTSGKVISNPADSGKDEIEVTANSPEAGKDTVTVPANGKVKIDDTEYDAGENGATIVAGADGNKLTAGSVKMDKADEAVKVGDSNTPVKNTGDKQIEVTADGTVKVPAEGEVEIGTAPNTAKITDVTKDTEFKIGADGKTSVNLPKEGSVTINGVTYTDDGTGSGKLTIDENGKVVGAEGVKVEIDESKLADKNFEYDLIPGVSVTVGKYTYTAPKTGKVGDVKLMGRGTDAEGKALNPAISIKDNDGTVEVALADKPETKTEYTAASAGTKFAMSANDTDTTKVDLLDNGQSANSALKFTDNDSHTVNGVTYVGQEIKKEDGTVEKTSYTVTFGEATVDSGKKDETTGDAIMETVNRNTVSVDKGSKVSASMEAKGTISIGSGTVGDKSFTDKSFTASNSGATIMIDNTDSSKPNQITGVGRSSVSPIYGTKADGTPDTDKILGYQVTRSSGGGGGSSSGSSVGVKSSQNGKITVSPSNAAKGTTVTITAKPDSGYKLGSLTVTDKNGNTVKLTQKGENVYTFEMPANGVTVEGTFVKTASDYTDCEKGKDCPIYPYADAQPTAWYHNGVHYCLDNGLMVGISDSSFAPNGNVTRGQIVTILWRQAGAPAVSGSSFSDVASNAYYAQAVAWAAQNGIVSGYSASKFGPQDPVTREQLAVILYRYAQFKNMDTTQAGMAIREYSDYDSISAYALQAMQWAVSAQVITGTSANTLSPAGTTTRAQAACMMQSFLTGSSK